MPETDRLPPVGADVPTIEATDTAWLTTAQMIEVDRLMIDEIGISLLQMMENAGRSLARLALGRWGADRIVVLAGPGGNGGGGLAAARHLANAGSSVSVCPARPREALSSAARHQLDALIRMGVPVHDGPPDSPPELVIDAVLGYSLHGAPRDRAAQLIEWASECAAPVLALDTPSGLDATTGATPGLVTAAAATLTLALPKVGLRRAPPVGELYLADISVPRVVYEAMGIGPIPSFRPSPILRVDHG